MSNAQTYTDEDVELREAEARLQALSDAVEMVRSRFELDGDKVKMVWQALVELRDDADSELVALQGRE